MTLGKTRIHQVGETPYPWEKEAIDFAIDVLPGNNPYQLWALTELLEPSSGRLYEIDMLIIGFGALYLVEVKSGPGRYRGDQVDWYRSLPDGGERWMEAPYPLANKKAKVLKSRLGAKMRGSRPPWIQPLVFLSSPDANLALTEAGRTCVVTRDTFARAITHGEFPGAMSGTYNRRITVPQSREIAQALEAIGIRPRVGKAMVGSYTLGDVLLEGAGYQDRKAVHKDNKSIKRRARIYLVPEQTSVERRQQLRRAADREAQLLNEVREHENVLTCTDFVSDAPLGPTVLFDDFENGIPLDAFLRKPPGLDFMDRIEIIKQVGRALAYCHRKNVFHGDVSPGSVLVRNNSEGALDVRLFNLQLGHGKEVESTRHWTAFISDRASVFAAPELREGYAERSVAADIYSLGALAYYILTGSPPGESVADVETMLDKNNCLDPESVDETLAGDVAELIRMATSRQVINRPDDVNEWVDLLLESATTPEVEDAPLEVNPLEAKKGDRLTGDFEVVGFLGHGATSRVLRVRRDGAEYALKVSLSELYDDLLKQEAEVLSKLRHANILQLHEVLTLSNRTALLLDLAGEHTMQIELRKEGSIAPEYAVRYGEQLLSTLTYLEEEEEGVLHKDIKPANLGVGKRKKRAHRLTLFDFSLANAPPSQLRIGTAAYRDPFLKERGKWDAAADRWSAAVTLHEALTGVRPELDDPGSAHPRVRIAAERFDPALRDRLTEFFTRAFLPDAAERHLSAKKMADRWRRCFEDPDHISTLPIAATKVSPTEPTWNQEILSAIEAETLIETLPLSPLAKSALNRAGLIRAQDLLSLPENRLSAIRGVGTKVAATILAFRRAWIEAQEIKETAVVPFFAGYRGDALKIDGAIVPAETATALTHAGIFTLTGLAESPKRQVENLANRHGFDTAPLQHRLEEENQKADELSHPSTLEGWIGALLPAKSSWRYPRRLFGIEAPFTGRLDVLTKEVAKHAKVTTGAVSIKMGKAREAWAAHTAVHELQDIVKRILNETGGAIRLERAGEQLLARLPHDKGAEKAGLVAHANALVRVVAELEKDEEQGLHFLRLKDGRPWILAEAAFAKVVKRLGAEADRLAQRSPLASPGEVERQLREAASGSTLAHLPAGRLAGIAAEASETGARSSRLEIYPRDIGPERLLELSAAQLRSGLTPTEVMARVAVRFPEASPLPGRPELDGLLGTHQLYWNAEKGKYERPGETQQTSLATQCNTTMTRLHTALPSQAKDMSEAAITAREFDEKLAVALERRSFRLLGVTADKAGPAALALAAKMQVQPISFDRLFLAALEKKMVAQNVQREVVHRTDREGPTGSQWHMLTSFAAKVAEDVAAELLPARKPLLLVQPGLTARYGLKDFLNRLVQSAGEEASEAIFLLVPCRGTSGVPRINGELAVPGVRASQTLWVAREWIANKHNAAVKEVG